MLLISTALYHLQPPADMASHSLPVVLTAVISGLWYIPSIYWLRCSQDVKPSFVMIYLLLGWGVWFALALTDPIFMLMLFALFPHIFVTLTLRWASFGAIILGALVALRQMTLWNFNFDSALLFTGLATVLGISLAYYIESIIRESTERRALIHRLESTQRELAAAERHAGILQERQRLAAEIHDTLAQGLISIVMHLEVAEVALHDDVKQARHHLDEARTAARDSLSEARRVVWGLLPEALEKQPFEIAVRQTVDDWGAANTVPTQFSVNGERQPLEPDQEHALLRVIQEALTNITKHADAQHVTVTLSYLPDRAIIDVQDDGKGFMPETITQPTPTNGRTTPRTSGFGLIGMRERLSIVGGQLTIESALGDGATIAAEMPYGTH
jgi:signal transduction histidine kinase